MLVSQLRVTSMEKIAIPASEQWSNARFAPDGKSIFVTNADYNGIWQYDFSSKLLREITKDKHSGFDFSISYDGSSIAFRRTVVEGDHLTRVQQTVEKSLENGSAIVRNEGNSIATPKFIRNTFAVPEKISASKSVGQTAVVVPGIEETKIVLYSAAGKTILDPLGNGRYIWPALSPDGKFIAAVEMDNGAFVLNRTTGAVTRIGKCNAPQWTKDGKWIIGMNDVDDGHMLLRSDIIAVAADGSATVQLTSAFDGIALYPACAPSENKIIFNTAFGELYLLTYEEVH